MRPDLKELIEIAERLGGDWRVERHDQDDGSITYEVWNVDPSAYARLFSINDDFRKVDAKRIAEYVAASQPRVVKPLLKELEEARARNKKAEELLFKSGAFLRNEAEVRAYGGRPDLPYEAAPRELADAISAFLREGKEEG